MKEKRKHPHARGEDILSVSLVRYEKETPPRTWGRPGDVIPKINTYRNTPTHVGKTRLRGHKPRHTGKHPHARGEDTKFIAKFHDKEETPPRTWGRPLSAHKAGTAYGNTPTHVGKTHPLAYPCGPREKHPHARGEDRGIHKVFAVFIETPPRTWGRRIGKTSQLRCLRNTPTHVGKTPTGGIPACGGRKHPHARGED